MNTVAVNSNADHAAHRGMGLIPHRLNTDARRYKPVVEVGLNSERPVSPKQNRLLAALPEAEYQRLIPFLDVVDLPAGHVIYECGDVSSHVYFPIHSIISLQYLTEDGNSVEISVIGNEGIVGIALLTGNDATPDRAVVQAAGKAYRLSGALLRREFNSDSVLHRWLLRYMQTQMTQMAQTAVCNRRHTVEQQLSRRLLMNLDRLPSNHLIMTHEQISNMLGVRREAVSEAAARLQASGEISYRRGHITILSRPGLEHRSCECYAIVKNEMAMLLAHGPRPLSNVSCRN